MFFWGTLLFTPVAAILLILPKKKLLKHKIGVVAGLLNNASWYSPTPQVWWSEIGSNRSCFPVVLCLIEEISCARTIADQNKRWMLSHDPLLWAGAGAAPAAALCCHLVVGVGMGVKCCHLVNCHVNHSANLPGKLQLSRFCCPCQINCQHTRWWQVTVGQYMWHKYKKMVAKKNSLAPGSGENVKMWNMLLFLSLAN